MSQIELEWTAPDSEISGTQLKEGITTLIAKARINGDPLADHLRVAAAACAFRASEFAGYDDDDFDIINSRILLSLIGGDDEPSS